MTAALARTGSLDWDEAGETVAADPAAWGDIILARKDTPNSYHLSVVVDDAAQGITDVVRGADLLDSTPRQILLRRFLGLSGTTWMHVPLVLDAQGRKLSKSEGGRAIDDADPLPALREALAFLGQTVPSHGAISRILDAAVRAFDLQRITPHRHAHAAMQKD
jgi:glutamyl-Q tRNA(Asp) synthetase